MHHHVAQRAIQYVQYSSLWGVVSGIFSLANIYDILYNILCSQASLVQQSVQATGVAE